MKKIISYIFILISFSIGEIKALEVDTDEIKVDTTKVKFENYQGSHSKIQEVWDIRGIGYYLSWFNKNNEIFRYHMKYSIVHAVDDSSPDKYDADIFSIDKDAAVDHIRNVRLMIAGYLKVKYRYTAREAYSLATFITFYNAVHRGEISYFAGKYKSIVLKFINENNAGIATKYTEWPGKTKIVIPLTKEARKKTKSSLNTSELTEEKTIDKMRQEEDKKIDERKEMTKIKEKEVENKQVDINKDKQKVNEQKKEVQKKEDELTKEKEQVNDIKKEREKEKKKEEIKKEEKKIEEKKQDIKKQEETINKKEEQVQKKQEEIKKEKEDIKKDETTLKLNKNSDDVKKELEKKSDELNKKEEELKKTEDRLKSGQTDKNVYGNKFYYLKIIEYTKDGHYNNEMYAIDAATRKVIVKSPLTKICGSKYDIFKDGVVVISYKEDHNSMHYLTLLDLDKLEIKYIGTDNIFWRSFVEIKDGFIYAIIKNQGEYYLGKFNEKLERIAISKEKIVYDTFITFYQDFIYINGYNKTILVLNKNDLTLVGTISP